MLETPTICASNYCSTTADLVSYGAADMCARIAPKQWQWGPGEIDKLFKDEQTKEMTTPMENTSTRRIVQVFIADPNENVPLDKSVLYTGEQKLTDLNDTELFFEIPIAETLKKHNDFRATCRDREASKRAGKDILLDPAKIRDLKMVVVTVAQF